MKKKLKFLTKMLMWLIVLQSTIGLSQTKEQKQKIISSYDLNALQVLQADFKKQKESDKLEVLEYLSRNRIQSRISLPNGGVAELMKIRPDGTPIYILWSRRYSLTLVENDPQSKQIFGFRLFMIA